MKVEIDVSNIIEAIQQRVQPVDTSDLACKVKDEMDIYHLQQTVESLENTVEALVRNMNKYRNAILAVGILDGGQDD